MLEGLLQESYLTQHTIYGGEDSPDKYFPVPVHSTAVLIPHPTLWLSFLFVAYKGAWVNFHLCCHGSSPFWHVNKAGTMLTNHNSYPVWCAANSEVLQLSGPQGLCSCEHGYSICLSRTGLSYTHFVLKSFRTNYKKVKYLLSCASIISCRGTIQTSSCWLDTQGIVCFATDRA